MDVTVDMQPAVLQVVVGEALCEFGAAGVLPVFGEIANAQGWSMSQENVRRCGYLLVNVLPLAGVVLECSE